MKKKMSTAERRKLIARILKPMPKPRWAMKGTDPRRFDQQYPEGATLAQVAKRIATLIDTGADPNQKVTITAGNTCHDIGFASTGFVTCDFRIKEDDVLNNAWRMVHVLKQIAANPRKYSKTEIVSACAEMLKLTGQNAA